MSKPIPFPEVIKALLDHDRPFPPKHLHRFSDLSPENLSLLEKNWQDIYAERRRALLEDLEEIAEVDTRVSFDDISRMALNDVDSAVRAVAIRLLWECEDTGLVPVFINMLDKDQEAIVRSAAATALGLFVYLGELEEISAEIAIKVEESLLKKISSDDETDVKRHALEALGYSSRPDIPPIILHAFNKNEKDWTISALFAMGRSLDQRWENFVLSSLENLDDDIQFEAIRAAGLLELSSARETLMKILLNEENIDDATRAATIMSLSQIGGEDVQEVLESMLEATDDDEEEEFIEEALENLFFNDGMDPFKMFDFDVQDEEDQDFLIDSDDEESEETPGE